MTAPETASVWPEFLRIPAKGGVIEREIVVCVCVFIINKMGNFGVCGGIYIKESIR